MKNIFYILIFISSVLSAQRYEPANLFIRNSIQVGISVNSIMVDTAKANNDGFMVMAVDGTNMTMDGVSYDIPTGYDSTNFYLDITNGDNSNSGTHPDSAWKNLWYAHAIATDPGDTVFLRRGEVWTRDSVFQITNSGDAMGDIVWDGNSWGTGDKAMIRATHAGGTQGIGYSVIRFADCRYVTFQNIIVDGGNYDEKHGIVIGGYSGTYGNPDQNDEHDITIQNCEVQNMGSSDYAIGILTQVNGDTISDVLITNNGIHDIASHGIAIYANRLEYGGSADALTKNIVISNNTITDIRQVLTYTGNGIHLTRQIDSAIVEYNNITIVSADICLAMDPGVEDGNNLELNRITIRYNWLQNSGDGLSALYFVPFTNIDYAFDFDIYGNVIIGDGNAAASAIFSSSGSDFSSATLDFYNNTVISTNGPGFYDNIDATITLNNNIFYNTSSTSDKWAYQDASGSGTLNHTYNLYFANQSGDWIDINGTGYNQGEISGWEGTAQTTDPTFTVEFTNLHLQTGSDAIDNGTAVAGYTEDIEGVAVGDPPNIGAYETTEDP